eukprot:g2901.t1
MQSLTLIVLIAANTISIARGEMYDMLFPLARSTCENGCARWEHLAKDGNTRKQSDVDSKWSTGKAPENSSNTCAMPSNDPDMTYWCYCAHTNDASWAYCQSPSTPVPEQINLQHSGDSEIAVVSFVTFGEQFDEDQDPPIVVYRKENDKTEKNSTGITRVYVDPGNEGRTYYMHFCKMSDLMPRTKYTYRVRSGGSDFSEEMTFTSLYTGDDNMPTRFAIFGDMGVYSYNNMANLERDVDAGTIDAIVHMGDHAYNIAEANGARGDGYLNAFQRVISRVPWVPVLGNHEFYENDFAHRYVNETEGIVYGQSALETHTSATPLNFFLAHGSTLGLAYHGGRSNGAPSGTSRFYSANIGLVHIVVLDFNTYYFTENEEAKWQRPQIEWLQKDLAAVDRAITPWVIAVAHYPIYCSSVTLAGPLHNDGQGDEDPGSFDGCWSYGSRINDLRNDVEPLFERYGVDAFLAGHEHDYESIYPTRNNTVLARSFVDPPCTVHFVSGAGGAPALDRFGDPGPFTRKQISSWGYGRIEVHNASVLHFEQDEGGAGVFADGAGGSQIHDSVVAAMVDQLRYGAANIGGYYASSERCLQVTSDARSAAADLFNADMKEVTFGNNMTTLTFHLAHSVAEEYFEAGDNIVLSTLDHDANVGPWIRVAQANGVDVRWIPMQFPDCRLDMDALDDLVDDRTKLVACGYASNAVGSKNDVERACAVAKSIGALSFVDAVHYAPHALLDVRRVGCDFMACSPYKFYGPHAGLLFGRMDIMGGHMRPFKIRPSSDDLPSIANYELSRWELGTQNFEALAGINACVEYIASIGERFGVRSADACTDDRRTRIVKAWELVESHERDLKRLFLEGAKNIEGLVVYGIRDETRIEERTSTFALGMRGLSPDELTRKLCEEGIFCTSGNHYCTFWDHPSLGLSNDEGATRVGFLHYNTENDVLRVLRALEKASVS